MDPTKQRPIQSLEEARDWERVFIGEIKAGRDPRRPRAVQKSIGRRAERHRRFSGRVCRAVFEISGPEEHELDR
jgi:hypothetical protein